MTKLELAICEAENAGEIDLDTRDTMLGILNESTAQARQAEKIKKELDCLMNSERDKLYKLLNQAKADGDQKMYKKVADKIGENHKKIYALQNKLREIDPCEQSIKAKENGKRASGRILYNKMFGGGYSPDRIKSVINDGKQASKCNRWRGNSKREPEVKGKYKTTNGLKESVLEEIYEAELCGDITPEERQSLIDYMNI